MQTFKINQLEISIIESVIDRNLTYDDSKIDEVIFHPFGNLKDVNPTRQVDIDHTTFASIIDELYKIGDQRSRIDNRLFIRDLLDNLIKQDKFNVVTPVTFIGMDQPVI